MYNICIIISYIYSTGTLRNIGVIGYQIGSKGEKLEEKKDENGT